MPPVAASVKSIFDRLPMKKLAVGNLISGRISFELKTLEGMVPQSISYETYYIIRTLQLYGFNIFFS